MTTQTIEFPASILRAVLTAAAVKDISRKYLCSVYLEPAAHGRARLVATDGHRLMVAQIANASDTPLTESVIIPRETFKALPRTHDMVRIEINGECRATFIGKTETAVIFKPMSDYAYPDYRRVLPSADAALAPSLGSTCINYNAEYLADMQRAYDALRGKSSSTPPVAVPLGGIAPAVVLFPGFENVLGLVMPVRDGGESTTAATAPAMLSKFRV